MVGTLYEKGEREITKPKREKGLYVETYQAQRSNAALIRLPFSVYPSPMAESRIFEFLRVVGYRFYYLNSLNAVLPQSRLKVTDEAKITINL